MDRIIGHLAGFASRGAALWRRFARHRTFKAAWIAIALAILYWGPIASDRYVSEATIIVERTDFSGGSQMDFASLLTGGKGGHDLLLLREYLLSVDMLRKLDARFHLRAHFSDPRRDPLSRMWPEGTSQEWFHRYYLSRVG
ncbi:MAG: chain-length determining protein, partial [Betaproteobacteria bacterium]|nr:chain-length determining protein [Betaproteobacteria bacterium]